MTRFKAMSLRAVVVVLAWALTATMVVTGVLPTPEARADEPSLTATANSRVLNNAQVATIEMTPRYWQAGDEVTITVTPVVSVAECSDGETMPWSATRIEIFHSGEHLSWSPSENTDYMRFRNPEAGYSGLWDARSRSYQVDGVPTTDYRPLSGAFTTTYIADTDLRPRVEVWGGIGKPAVYPTNSNEYPKCEGQGASTDINWDLPALPVPVFSWSVEPGTRTVEFTDNTVMDIGEGFPPIISWNFGVDSLSTGSGPNPTYTYSEDGEYTITHRVVDRFNRWATVLTTIRIGAEPMQGELFVLDGGDTIKEGTTLPLRLRVENHDVAKPDATPPEDGWFRDVKVVSAKVLALDEDGNPIDEPVAGPDVVDPGDGDESGDGDDSDSGEEDPAPEPLAVMEATGAALPTEIQPGTGGLGFTDFDLTANRAGEIQAQVEVSAKRSNGETITKTFTRDITIKPSPLTVTIVQDPAALVYGQDNNDDGEITDEDNEFDIAVTVKNQSGERVETVESTDPAQPLHFTGKIGELSAAVALARIDTEGTSFGDLEPGAEKTLTYRYRAMDRVLADAKYVVSGVQNGTNVVAHGVTEIKVSEELWLEAEFDRAEPGRVYKAGQTVRLSGTIKNVTKVLAPDKSVVEEGFRVGVLIEPEVEGNAGGGHLFKASYGGQTPLVPTPFQLDPDEEIELAAVLGTLETDQPSAATVTYTVHVYKLEDPDNPVAGDETNYTITDGTEKQQVTLTPVPKYADEWLRCPAELDIISFLSCRFTLGVKSFGIGLYNLVAIVAHGLGEANRAFWGVLSTEIWAMGQIVDYLRGDEAAVDRLATEILIDIQALKDVGVQTLQAVTPTKEGVKTAVFGVLDSFANKMHTNSLRDWAGDLTEFAGANLDSTGALANMVVKRVALKVMAGAAGREGAERTALEAVSREQVESLGARVASAETAGQNLTKGVLKAGDDVTGMTKVLEAFGASKADITKMLRIAKEEGVNLLFRARNSRAITLLEDGLAWAKPSGVSIKTVSEIDVKFLGYKLEWEARAVLVEPPIKWKPAGSERNTAIEQYLNQFTELSGTSGAARDLRAAVKSRMEQRLDEWPVQLQKFSGYAEHGIDASFYAEKQGLKKGLIANEKKMRKAEVISETLAGTSNSPARKVFQLKMAGPDGAMKWITGDIDFLAILNPDGSIVQDIVKRTRIYESMRALLGMQHGESMTFSGSGKLRQKFLGCCTAEGETMLAATFDGRVVATHFDDALAVMPQGLNAAMMPAAEAEAIDSMVFLTGVTSEMVSAKRAGATVPLPPITEFVVNFIADKVKPVPTDLKGVMEALAKLEGTINGPRPAKPATFDRNGKPIAASGTADTSGTDYVPVIYTVNEKTGQFDRLRAPGRAFAVVTRGSSYAPGAVFRTDVPDLDAGDALTQAWADLVDDGYPQPEVGSWRTLGETDVDSAGDAPAVAPFTLIGSEAPAGTTTLDVLTAAELEVTAGSPFFQAGDHVVVDPATEGEEFAIVRSYDAASGAMVLVSPLQSPHLMTARVQFLAPGAVPPASDSGGGSGSGSGSGADSGSGTPAMDPVTATVPAGGTASSAPNNTPTAANPIVAQVTSPMAGEISFASGGAADSQAGYSMLGQAIVITAPTATAATPLRIAFHVTAQAMPRGTDASDLVVFRNGDPVARCADPRATAAAPDPCVASVSLAGGVVTVQVRSSHASVWTVGVPAAERAGSRIAGANRYETSALVAERFGRATAVILANGSVAKSGADALAANVLAGRVGAPILLSESTSVAPSVLSAARTVLSGAASPTIYVMGDVDSVSDEVAERVRTSVAAAARGTVHVVRVAGSDRYATAAAAASYGDAVASTVRLSPNETGRRTAILASGIVNADALAAGALSYAWGVPVLLTGAGALSDHARSVIVSQGITQLIALGGVDRISPRALDDARAAGVTGIERIAGADRYESAAQLYGFVAGIAVGPDGKHYGRADPAGTSNVYIANGHTGFPDALSVGPLAGKEEAPLLTVGPMALPPSTRDYLTARADVGRITVLGNYPTISAGVHAAAHSAIGAREVR